MDGMTQAQSPKAPSTCTHEPAACACWQIANRVDGARIDVSDLRHDKRAFVEFRHFIRQHASVVIRRNDLDVISAKPQH